MDPQFARELDDEVLCEEIKSLLSDLVLAATGVVMYHLTQDEVDKILGCTVMANGDDR